MMAAVFVDLLSCAREHIGRQVDAGDFAMMGISGKRGSGAGANFAYLRAYRDIEILNHPFDATVEQLAENSVVEGSELSVQFAFVRLNFSHAPQPQSTTFA